MSGLSVLDGATMWAGRRDSNPFLMSSGLLPPNPAAMRFGVDNARVLGDIGLSYQYTARNDQRRAKTCRATIRCARRPSRPIRKVPGAAWFHAGRGPVGGGVIRAARGGRRRCTSRKACSRGPTECRAAVRFRRARAL
ncbi:hypothetical protein ACTMU2_37975 [Cupriavidus basilensis]